MDKPYNRTLRERLFFFLQTALVYKPTRDYYISRQDADASQSSNDEKSSRQPGKGTALGSSLSEDRSLECDRSDICLPELTTWVERYTKISSVVLVYGFLQASLLILINESILDIDRGWTCYILGRLTVHPSAVEQILYFQWLSTGLLMCWRLAITRLHKAYRLDCIIFLATDEKKLQDHAGSGFDIKLGKSSMRPWLRRALYLEIYQSDGRHLLFLRPNRTMEAHERLAQFFKRFFVLTRVIAASLISFIGPMIVGSILLDLSYIRNYPTCMPELEELAHEGRLPFWSMSVFGWPNHRWLTLPFDMVLNVFVWCTDITYLFIPTSLAILFSQDLIIYWGSIAGKLESLLLRLKRLPVGPDADGAGGLLVAPNSSDELANRLSSLSRAGRVESTFPQRGHLNRVGIYRRGHFGRSCFLQGDQLDLETDILQQQIVDFFRQLKYYNKYVSVLVTFAFLAWFSLFMATSYLAHSLQDTTLINIVRVGQVYGCMAVLAPLYFLLRVRNQTKRYYRMIASIMCLERTPVRKIYWSQILEHYTYRPAFGFTLVNSLPVTWMTYLNLIATSVSFLVILDTLEVYNNK